MLTQVTDAGGRIRVEVRATGFQEPVAVWESDASTTGAYAFIELGKLVIAGLYKSAFNPVPKRRRAKR